MLEAENLAGVAPTHLLSKAAQQGLEVLDQNFYMGDTANKKKMIFWKIEKNNDGGEVNHRIIVIKDEEEGKKKNVDDDDSDDNEDKKNYSRGCY